MLVLAVKLRAGNNLIMRLEMPGGVAGGGGRCRPSAVRSLRSQSCQRVSCLSPCFSLAPRRAAVRADGAGPWPRAAAGLGAHTPPPPPYFRAPSQGGGAHLSCLSKA